MDRSLFNCIDCGTLIHNPTDCKCEPCRTKSNSKEKEQIMTEPTITTEKQAKAYFKDKAVAGHTLADWREFMGTLCNQNLSKYTALQLYDLKLKMEHILFVPGGTTVENVAKVLTKPTTDKEAKAHFKSIAISGYTLRDWREFIGNLSGVNTKGMKPLELYHLKERLNKALRRKPVKDPVETTAQKMKRGERMSVEAEQAEKLNSFLLRLENKVDILIAKLDECVKPDIKPSVDRIEIAGESTISVAGNDGIFKPVELKHTGIVGWFKRRFNRDNATTTILWILILGMFPLMFTPVARIFEWLPKLFSCVGGIF